MGPTAIWAGTALVVAVLIIWRVDRFATRRLNARLGGDEVTVMERRTKALIRERTLDERVELDKAELRRRTAAADAAAGLDEELAAARLDAERRILHARTDARINAERRLAVEVVRADHEAARTNTTADILALYQQVLAATHRSTVSDPSLKTFLGDLREHGLL